MHVSAAFLLQTWLNHTIDCPESSYAAYYISVEQKSLNQNNQSPLSGLDYVIPLPWLKWNESQGHHGKSSAHSIKDRRMEGLWRIITQKYPQKASSVIVTLWIIYCKWDWDRKKFKNTELTVLKCLWMWNYGRLKVKGNFFRNLSLIIPVPQYHNIPYQIPFH